MCCDLLYYHIIFWVFILFIPSFGGSWILINGGVVEWLSLEFIKSKDYMTNGRKDRGLLFKFRHCIYFWMQT